MSAIHVLHVAPSLGIGGREARMATLIDRLGDDFHHTLTALDGDVGMLSLVQNRHRVSIATAAATGHFPLRDVSRLLRQNRPNVLATYNWGAVAVAACAACLWHRSIVHTEDGFDADEAQRLKSRRVLFRRAVLPFVEKTVVISRTLFEVARLRFRVPNRRLTYIPNAIDSDRFTPGPAGSAAAEIPEGRFVIGTVARLRPEKNLGVLIDILPDLADINPHLVIVGEGQERRSLETRATERGVQDRVTFAGNRRNTEEWYRSFDLYALSSTTEQAPLTILEAMATALPIVATAVGDVPQMLAPEACHGVVPLGQTQMFAAQVRRFARSVSLRRQAGADNRAHVVREYSLPVMVERYAGLYRTVAECL